MKYFNYNIKKCLSVIVLIFSAVTAYCCKCSEPGSVESSLKYADMVVWGKVLKVSYVGFADSMHPDSALVAEKIVKERKDFLHGKTIMKIVLEVKRTFKGAHVAGTLEIYTGITGASCGFRFIEGKEYVIYGESKSYLYSFLDMPRERAHSFRKKKAYWTNHCTRTTEYAAAEIQALNNIVGK